VQMLETDLMENIIRLVERRYRVSTDRNRRAIAGLSMGGYQTLDTSLNHHQLFAYVAGLSSALVGPKFETNLQTFLSDPGKANRELKLLSLSCGGDDRLLAPNLAFDQVFIAMGIRHQCGAWPQGMPTGGRSGASICAIFLPQLFND
jgi:enterochelin esterase-like enzyme